MYGAWRSVITRPTVYRPTTRTAQPLLRICKADRGIPRIERVRYAVRDDDEMQSRKDK